MPLLSSIDEVYGESVPEVFQRIEITHFHIHGIFWYFQPDIIAFSILRFVTQHIEITIVKDDTRMPEICFGTLE
ncbi:hypothetical protein D3C81_1930840 [compost metagenome]